MGGQHPLCPDSRDGNCCRSCSLEPRGCQPFISPCNAGDRSPCLASGAPDGSVSSMLRKYPWEGHLSLQLQASSWDRGSGEQGRCYQAGPVCVAKPWQSLAAPAGAQHQTFYPGMQSTRGNKLMTGKATLWLPFSGGAFSPSCGTSPN